MDRRGFLTQLAAVGLVVSAAELVQRSYFFGPWLPARPSVMSVPWGDSVRYFRAGPVTRVDLEAEKLRFDIELARQRALVNADPLVRYYASELGRLAGWGVSIEPAAAMLDDRLAQYDVQGWRVAFVSRMLDEGMAQQIVHNLTQHPERDIDVSYSTERMARLARVRGSSQRRPTRARL